MRPGGIPHTLFPTLSQTLCFQGAVIQENILWEDPAKTPSPQSLRARGQDLKEMKVARPAPPWGPGPPAPTHWVPSCRGGKPQKKAPDGQHVPACFPPV